MNGPLVAGIAGLVLALATGGWLGYRYAVCSRRLDAILIQALDALDTRPEDEVDDPVAPARTAGWDAVGYRCGCASPERGWSK